MIFNISYPAVFLIALPIVSFLYSGVGHGGASGYLALMALFSFAPEEMKPTALLLNLFVAGAAFLYYYKGGYFNKKLFFVFAITSIPMAFWGGTIEVEAFLYRKTLAVLLLLAILKILNVFGGETSIIRKVKIWQGLLIGAFIGFFSGLIGIGGGIILSPVILLFHWGKMKEAAAVSALFIWVNSLSGLVGQFSSGVGPSSQSFILVAIALLGGVLGGYFGSKKLQSMQLRYMLAFVLLIASFKLFIT